MSESFLDGKVTLHRGDCLEVLRELEENSVDSVVCDPPYHLTSIVKRFATVSAKDIEVARANPHRRTSSGFMGKQWDGGDVAFQPETWALVARVLKPGGHLLAFSGTRTYHRMACAIEDAGFEIRDQIGWCYGLGFPKSHDVSKGIDRLAGVEREKIITGTPVKRIIPGADQNKAGWEKNNGREYVPGIEIPATEAAIQWQGWGTALKPSYEPIVLAQKPYTPQQTLAMLVPTIGEQLCRVALSAKTDTHLFESELAHGFLSTAISLSSALEDLLHRVSMCTTETAIALTIDLKILNSLLSKITHAITTGELKRINGGEFDVRSAVAISESVLAKCERLTSTTADELVISELAETESALVGSPISPNWDCIVLARKPLSESSIAANVLEWGCGGINVDGCRVGVEEITTNGRGKQDGATPIVPLSPDFVGSTRIGRWPANLIHDGSEEVLAEFPDAGGGYGVRGTSPNWGPASGNGGTMEVVGFGDSGSAARFFYTAKADANDRLGSHHPTVKPLDLMQYLVRLVTPKGGTVLDPFAGTGTTGEAAWREGVFSTLIEREPEYQADIVKRMGLCLSGPDSRRAASTPQLPPHGLFEGLA